MLLKIKPLSINTIKTNVMKEEIPKYINDYSSQNGFDVPGNYFEKSRAQLLTKISHGGFNTPDGYFEASKKSILASIKPKQKQFHIQPFWYAAAITLMISGILFLTNIKTSTPTITQLTDDEIIQYAAQVNLQDITLEMLATNDVLGIETSAQEEEIVDELDTETILNEL